MRHPSFTIWLPLGLVAALAAPAAWGQGRMGRMGGSRRYDPATEITVKGTVESVREVGRAGSRAGTHLSLKTGGETLDVRLGPSSFLASKGFTIAKGDQVEVTGSEVAYNGREVLLAREVKKGDQTLTLRDAKGVPQWSGGARSGMGPMGPGGMDMDRGRGMGAGTAASGLSGAENGKAIFVARCAMCHSADATEKKIGPALKGLFQQEKLANGKKATEANIRAVIEEGAKGMPAYAQALAPREVDDLVAYLKTL